MYLEQRRTLASQGLYLLRRREQRYVVSIPLTLLRFLRFGPALTRGMTLDISMRGMSALVCGAPRVGETVVIELPLPIVPSKCWRRSDIARMQNLALSFSHYARRLTRAWERGSRNYMPRR